MNDNIAEHGKATRFTSENQPDYKERAKKKHWKRILRERIIKEFEPMLDSIIKDIKKNGNSASFDKLMDRAFGKIKEKADIKTDNTIKIVREIVDGSKT